MQNINVNKTGINQFPALAFKFGVAERRRNMVMAIGHIWPIYMALEPIWPKLWSQFYRYGDGVMDDSVGLGLMAMA